ncbi:hypothetical protein D3C85_1719120 [compost metagenome]
MLQVVCNGLGMGFQVVIAKVFGSKMVEVHQKLDTCHSASKLRADCEDQVHE